MRTLMTAASIAALCAAAPAPLHAQTSKTFKTRLSPVPIDLTMAATITGSGSVTAVLNGSKLTFSGTFEGLSSPATLAQLHKSPVAGVRGPVVFDLTVTHAVSGTIGGTVELTPAQVTDLEKHRLYVQVHSEKAPDGNLWGWLFQAPVASR
jgi:CHRD domain-containing protein